MKLKVFNETNSKSLVTGKPTIRFSIPGGLIGLSTGTCDLLKIDAKSKVEFFQNEENPKDWYVKVDNIGTSDGFRVRKTSKDNSRLFALNCTSLAKKVLGSVGLKKTAAFQISQKPIEIDGVSGYHLLLTSNPVGGGE